jgi:hypothetical protein
MYNSSNKKFKLELNQFSFYFLGTGNCLFKEYKRERIEMM